MSRTVFTSFLDGFAMAGLFGPLRRRNAPTQAFAPSRQRGKFVIVVDDDTAAERLEELRHVGIRIPTASYSMQPAEIYIRDRSKAS